MCNEWLPHHHRSRRLPSRLLCAHVHAMQLGLAYPIFGEHIFTDRDLLTESGNGMHVTSIATVMLLLLGCIEFSTH